MILVTGSTGLLGSHLLVELSLSYDKIRASYRVEEKIRQVEKLFRFYLKGQYQKFFERIEWVKCDLSNFSELEDLFRGIEMVYHCSGKVSFYKSDFNSCLQNNKYVTSNIVNFSIHHRVKKLCYVSSTAAIGVNSKAKTTELDIWENGKSISGYSVSKFSAEKEVWRGIEEGLNAVIINPCVILGPGNWNESSLTIFKTAEKGISFYPSGRNAIVDARDVAKSMLLLMESSIHSERFLCTGVNITFRDLFSNLCLKFGKKAPSISVPRWLTLLVAFISETTSRLTGRKSGISIETAYSAYKSIEYDNSKLRKAIDVEFHTLEETIDNAIAFKHFDS
jgi:nucleoside-diphosphate-sugar epimerase